MTNTAIHEVNRPARFDAIDLLRGLVMVIMALDHVRDFASNRLLDDPTDLNSTTTGIFLTRWITHYCAPTFIFLAGTSAYLSRSRGKSKRELSWFLLTRGLWLAIFEITICRALWMFNYDWYVYGAGVFWAIGWSMIVLAGLIVLPTYLVTLVGLAMIAFHNLLDGCDHVAMGLPKIIWCILHQPGEHPIYEGCPITFGTAYCVIPWAGVMAVGYGFGSLFRLNQNVRRWCFMGLGLAAIILFVILRAKSSYGDARLWEHHDDFLKSFLSFLNCTKYPPSLHYLLMTLGPAILALSLFDRPLPAWANPILTFGRVPLFYYILHIILIHGGVVVIDWIRFGYSPWFFAPPLQKELLPPNYGLGLFEVYVMWIVVLLSLYYPCRWYAGVKARNQSVWLSYL